MKSKGAQESNDVSRSCIQQGRGAFHRLKKMLAVYPPGLWSAEAGRPARVPGRQMGEEQLDSSDLDKWRMSLEPP